MEMKGELCMSRGNLWLVNAMNSQTQTRMKNVMSNENVRLNDEFSRQTILIPEAEIIIRPKIGIRVSDEFESNDLKFASSKGAKVKVEASRATGRTPKPSKLATTQNSKKTSVYNKKIISKSKPLEEIKKTPNPTTTESLTELRKQQIEDELNLHNKNIDKLQRRLSSNLDKDHLTKVREQLENEKLLLRRSIKDAITEQRRSRTEKWNSISVVNLTEE